MFLAHTVFGQNLLASYWPGKHALSSHWPEEFANFTPTNLIIDKSHAA
jgi:hypothetical protein